MSIIIYILGASVKALADSHSVSPLLRSLELAESDEVLLGLGAQVLAFVSQHGVSRAYLLPPTPLVLLAMMF